MATLVVTSTGYSVQQLQAFRVTGDWTNPLRSTAEPGKSDDGVFGTQDDSEYEFNITEYVQNWYLGKYGNYGVMIANASGGGKALYSSDNATAALKPKLYVGYGDYGGGTLATGTYYIKNQFQGKYLDVPGGSAGDGAAVQMNNFTGKLAQQWYVDNKGDGTYKIYSMLNLDVYKGDDINETKLQLWTENYNKQSKLRIWAVNGSRYKVMPCSTYTKAFDVYQGSDSSLYGKKVQIYTSGIGSNQEWVFEPQNSGREYVNHSGGFYVGTSSDNYPSGKCAYGTRVSNQCADYLVKYLCGGYGLNNTMFYNLFQREDGAASKNDFVSGHSSLNIDDVHLMLFVGHGLADTGLHFTNGLSHGANHAGSSINFSRTEAKFGANNAKTKWVVTYTCNFLNGTDASLKGMMYGANAVLGYSTRSYLVRDQMQYFAERIKRGDEVIETWLQSGKFHTEFAPSTQEEATLKAVYDKVAYNDTVYRYIKKASSSSVCLDTDTRTFPSKSN